MTKRMSVVTILLLFSLTAGCTSLPEYRPELPDDLGDNGLVVGQVVGFGRLLGWSMYKDVLIDNHKKGTVVNSFISIPLSPGEYEFSSLFSASPGGSNAYGGVTVTMTNTTTMPVKRKFTVRSKQITNLGLLVLYPDQSDKDQNKFLRMFVDNTVDMKHFIKTAYPVQASRLNVDAMTLAPGELMPDGTLQLLRKELATKLAVAPGSYVSYVAADLGTLAEVQKGKDNKPVGVKLMNVATVSNLQSASPNYVKDRFAILTKNNRLFLVKGDNVVEKRPPAGLRAGSVFVMGTNDLVIVDDKFELYVSSDNADRWQQSLAWVTQESVRTGASPGANGYYAYTVEPPRALIASYGKLDFRPVELPKDMETLGLLREKPAGLFAERDITFYMESEKRPFFFRASNQSAWETRSMPVANCKHIDFLDSAGLNISTECSDRAVWHPAGKRQQYLSKDGGRTWDKK
jgi:hypothetical protein